MAGMHMGLDALLKELFVEHGHLVTAEAQLEGHSGSVYTIPLLCESERGAVIVAAHEGPLTADDAAAFRQTVADVGADRGILVHLDDADDAARAEAGIKVVLWDRQTTHRLLGELRMALALGETPAALPLDADDVQPGTQIRASPFAPPPAEPMAEPLAAPDDLVAQADFTVSAEEPAYAPPTAEPDTDAVTEAAMPEAGLDLDALAAAFESSPADAAPAPPEADSAPAMRETSLAREAPAAYAPVAHVATPEAAYTAPSPPVPAFAEAPRPAAYAPSFGMLLAAASARTPGAFPPGAAPSTPAPAGPFASVMQPALAHAATTLPAAHAWPTQPASPASPAPHAPPAPPALPARPPRTYGRPLLPVRIRPEDATRRVRDRLYSPGSVELVLHPVHLFDYECDLLQDGKLSFDTQDGRIQVHGADRSVVDVDPDEANPDAPGLLPPHHEWPVTERVLRVPEERAHQLAVQAVIKKHTRTLDVRVPDANHSLFYMERRKHEPKPEQVRLRPLGVFFRPAWRLHGDNGYVDVDAVDGRELDAQLIGSRHGAMILE